VLRTQAVHGTRLSVVETVVKSLDDLEPRLLDVEDVVAVHRKTDERKTWRWPAVTTIGATLLNALLTSIAYLTHPPGS